MKILASLVLSLTLTNSMATQASNWLSFSDLDRDQISQGSRVLQQFHNDKPSGTMDLRTTITDSQIIVEDFSKVPGMNIDEHIRSAMDIDNGKLISNAIKGHFGPTPVDVNLKSTTDGIAGKILAKNDQGGRSLKDVSMPFDGFVFERAALFGLVHALPLKDNTEFKAQALDTLSWKLNKLTIDVGELTKVSVPAGTFKAWPVTFKGAPVTQVIYVSNESDRRIVRIDIPNTPWTYKLASLTQ